LYIAGLPGEPWQAGPLHDTCIIGFTSQEVALVPPAPDADEPPLDVPPAAFEAEPPVADEPAFELEPPEELDAPPSEGA
jgi:hypothetical protein